MDESEQLQALEQAELLREEAMAEELDRRSKFAEQQAAERRRILEAQEEAKRSAEQRRTEMEQREQERIAAQARVEEEARLQHQQEAERVLREKALQEAEQHRLALEHEQMLRNMEAESERARQEAEHRSNSQAQGQEPEPEPQAPPPQVDLPPQEVPHNRELNQDNDGWGVAPWNDPTLSEATQLARWQKELAFRRDRKSREQRHQQWSQIFNREAAHLKNQPPRPTGRPVHRMLNSHPEQAVAPEQTVTQPETQGQQPLDGVAGASITRAALGDQDDACTRFHRLYLETMLQNEKLQNEAQAAQELIHTETQRALSYRDQADKLSEQINMKHAALELTGKLIRSDFLVDALRHVGFELLPVCRTTFSV